jgi:glycopeptide antibiotics resistance protein
MLMPLAVLLRQNFPSLRMNSIFIICLLTTVFIELIQIFIPGRVSDIRDVVVNCLGVSIAIWIMKIVRSSAVLAPLIPPR